jgi:hypothetical protein
MSLDAFPLIYEFPAQDCECLSAEIHAVLDDANS